MRERTVQHSHLIEIDRERRVLSIFRIVQGKEKQFYTSIDLPRGSIEEDRDSFDRFAQMLGENILMDSPQARDALGI